MTDSKPPEQRDTKRVLLIFAGGLALYLLLGLFLWWLLNVYVDPTAIEDSAKEATAKKDLVQALGFIMAGVAGAVGIFFTWRNLQQSQASLWLTRKAQEQNQQDTQKQLRNAQEELRLTRQGQMTERFTQAIEQLGSEKLEIKLGGIYSLERTAHEEKNYHWPVMEVLTSYVRRHAARKPEKGSRENATPEPDIRAILDVIVRRSEYHRIDKGVEYGTIELNDTDLQGANLQGAPLGEANLQGANLQGANLQGAKLQGADLPGAKLQSADLHAANLQKVDLSRANLQGADLHAANLQEGWLIEAKVQRADLSGADLQGAVLSGADLEGANLQGANLQGAYLTVASLQGADLQGTDLRGTKNLDQQQIERTIGDDKTTLLAEGLHPPEMWSKSKAEQYNLVRGGE